jgi:hypothetical protein
MASSAASHSTGWSKSLRPAHPHVPLQRPSRDKLLGSPQFLERMEKKNEKNPDAAAIDSLRAGTLL